MLKEAATACDKGDPIGCHNLAVAYWQGDIVPRDIDKATSMLEAACEKGAILSCSLLHEVDPDRQLDGEESAGRIALACENGLPSACDRWAELLEQAGRTVEALEQAQAQCFRQPSASCVIAGSIIEDDDPEQAMVFYNRGCAQGIIIACRYQADLMMKSIDAPEPPQQVFSLFTRACRGGDATGCLRVAELYTNGVGPREDPTYAARMREEACFLGLAEACTGDEPAEDEPPMRRRSDDSQTDNELD